MSLERFHSLLEPLHERFEDPPARALLTFVEEDGHEREVTVASLASEVRGLAGALRSSGIERKDLVVLVLPDAADIVTSFWAALECGAMPAIFPHLTPKQDPGFYRERVRLLVEHAGPRAVVTTPDQSQALSELLNCLDCTVHTLEGLRFSPRDLAARPSAASPEDEIALVQYTSGTTGLQKGIALSHRAILNNLEAIRIAAEMRDDDTIVTWLPLHHDMGLLTGCLLPLVLGIPAVVLSPLHWVRDPALLLRKVHQHRGTLTWMPNFAFNHSVRGIRDRDLEGLDLRCWRRLYNASEPVRAASLDAFFERFGPFGLTRSALGAGYGLAEITGAVSLTPIGHPPRVEWLHVREFQADGRAVPAPAGAPGSIPVVSSGALVPGAQVSIVDGNDRPVEDRTVGHILVRSNSMLRGYYRRDDLTAEATRLGWHRTGDLGFLCDGELFVTGRVKDLIISGGKNIYPEDLEALADTLPDLRPGRSAAFGVPDPAMGTEAIVMVCELAQPASDDAVRVAQELRRVVARSLDVTLNDVRFVERGWVLKTPAGKMARSANRDKYRSLPDAFGEGAAPFTGKGSRSPSTDGGSIDPITDKE